eukprot:119574-Prymnesium_polylepis.1
MSGGWSTNTTAADRLNKAESELSSMQTEVAGMTAKMGRKVIPAGPLFAGAQCYGGARLLSQLLA